MEWLPPVVVGGGNYFLPLCEPSAARLAAAWSVGNTSAAQQYVHEAMAEDPALALWMLLQSPWTTAAQLPSIAELAPALAAAGPGPFASAGSAAPRPEAPED